MIIQFGLKDEASYGNWDSCSNVFISRPYIKIINDDGSGIYVLNSYLFKLLPKFYFFNHITYLKCGVNFAGWTIELLFNKK